MTYLENAEVRVGMDLALGGAVTFMESKARPGNLINSADLGRQIQMSHYSGPWPFTVGDKQPNPAWAGLGWNPIQTGDCYMNPSTVLEHRNNGKEIYIRCIPMQWPMDDVPGDCIFETWTTLEGPLIRMRFRCTNQRADTTRYRPGAQELPAVYTISRLWRLVAYTGDQPFTGAAVSHVPNNWRNSWPWTRFTATERWAALVGDDDWGLGVFKDDGGEFHGGIYGDERSDDPKHGTTAYVAPIHRENFDHNIVYEHTTDFMIGRLDEIRARFNQLATKTPPHWRFEKDRQHWTLTGAEDQGFPLNGEWKIQWTDSTPRVQGPTYCWRAEDAPVLEIAMAVEGPVEALRIEWAGQGQNQQPSSGALSFAELVRDGAGHTYSIDLSTSADYRGLITGLQIAPQSDKKENKQLVIRSIRLRKKVEDGGGSQAVQED